MKHEDFVFEDNSIQYRFSKKEMEDIEIDLKLVKSMKVFIQKQHDCESEFDTAKAHVLLSVMPTEKTSNFGFGDKTRWFKTDIVDKDLTQFHKRLFNITKSTNKYIAYTICLIKNNEYVMNIIDKLACDFYDNVVEEVEEIEVEEAWE